MSSTAPSTRKSDEAVLRGEACRTATPARARTSSRSVHELSLQIPKVPEPTGRLHSFESCGTVDGPGLRFVLFTQGCPLRCRYCHNPDTWSTGEGTVYSVSDVLKEAQKYRSYMNFSGGGVTVSGGEPLLQPEFVAEFLKRCKEEGIHTALDTSGIFAPEKVESVYEYTDLVLLDLKCMNARVHRELTLVDVAGPLRTAEYLAAKNIPVWVRHVVIPGINDNPEYLHDLARFVAPMKNVEKFELLPFHQMGEYKWESLGMRYTLQDVEPPSDEQMEAACEIFRSYGIDPQ